jgi:hypothetical protein
MTTERLHNGAWQVSGMVEDVWGEYLLTRTYYGYTKREAVALFREECRTMTTGAK